MKTTNHSFFHLTTLECSALRTIAIIAIVLHNYTHKLPNAAIENEFSYHLEHELYFSNTIFSSNFFINLFSYWGHLGVPIFVFLSGYGLALKYGNKSTIKSKDFVLSHYRKLFYPILLGTILYIFIMFLFHEELSFSIPRFMLQCSMLLNLAYPYELYFTPGPYWYFGMTMQIYIIYRYVIHHRSTTFLISLTIVSLILMGLLYNYNSIVVWTKCNVIGWMAPLCIGIIVSNNLYKYDIQLNRKYLLALFVFSLLILIFCGKNYYLWLLTPIPVISIAISIVKMMPSTIWEKTQMIGNASLYILIIHPIVRDVTLPLFNIWGVWSIAFYFLISLLLSLILFFTVNMFNSHNKINSNNGATKS